MNLLFLLNNDKYAAKALQQLLPAIITSHKIKILISDKQKKGLSHELLKLYNFEKFQLSSWKKLFPTAAVCDDINDAATISQVQEFNPDLIISIRFEHILQQAIINCARLGVINLHSGILPNYRGIMASFWKVLNGENELGTTIHYIQDQTIDTGDIISVTRQEFNRNLSLSQNVENLYDEACKKLLDVIWKIEQGEEIKTIKQNDIAQGCYYSYPKDEDIQKFLKISKLF